MFKADGDDRVCDALFVFGRRNAAVEERQLHVFKYGRAGEQVERLKHKADLIVARLGHLIIGEFARLLAVENIRAASRLVEKADDMHERGFAGAGRTHYGHEFAFLNIKSRLRQSHGFHVFVFVDFLEVFY